MKLRLLDVHTAFDRVVLGEPVTLVAKDFGVSESALRWRFKSEGWDAGEVRLAARALFNARIAYEALSKQERQMVDRLLAGAKGGSK